VHYLFSGRLRYLAAEAVHGEQNVNAVERAMDIVVQPAVHAFYTTQFAGDMPARFADIR
jgi:hypothetical protein